MASGLPWIITSEIYPLRLRGLLGAWSAMCQVRVEIPASVPLADIDAVGLATLHHKDDTLHLPLHGLGCVDLLCRMLDPVCRLGFLFPPRDQ